MRRRVWTPTAAPRQRSSSRCTAGRGTPAWSSRSGARISAATLARSRSPAAAATRARSSATALREAEEEIGLAPDAVEVVGALPPIGTFVTNYKVHPFVGLIGEGLRFEPNPTEVESVLIASLDDLAGGYAKRRLVRRGVPIKTDTYEISDRMIWGATARILGELFERLGRTQR